MHFSWYYWFNLVVISATLSDRPFKFTTFPAINLLTTKPTPHWHSLPHQVVHGMASVVKYNATFALQPNFTETHDGPFDF